jgi:hypothetical protein
MQCNEMKVYFGFSSPNERNECACEDWECRKQKKELLFFLAALAFGFKWSVEWKLVKRLKQPNVTKQTIVVRPLDCLLLLNYNFLSA